MREDVGEVTTSLHRPETSKSRSGMPYDSFEWQQEPPPSNGVARSAWTRSHRRLSRWHRPYTLILIIMDFLSASLASYLAVTFIQKADSGFQNSVGVFYFDIAAECGHPERPSDDQTVDVTGQVFEQTASEGAGGK